MDFDPRAHVSGVKGYGKRQSLFIIRQYSSAGTGTDHSPLRSRSDTLQAFLRFRADFLVLLETGLCEVNRIVGQVARNGLAMVISRSHLTRGILLDFLANDTTLLEAFFESTNFTVDGFTERGESSFNASGGLVRLVLDVRVRGIALSCESILAIHCELTSVSGVGDVLLSLVRPQREETKETSLVALFVTGRVLVDDFGFDFRQAIFSGVDGVLSFIANGGNFGDSLVVVLYVSNEYCQPSASDTLLGILYLQPEPWPCQCR